MTLFVFVLTYSFGIFVDDPGKKALQMYQKKQGRVQGNLNIVQTYVNFVSQDGFPKQRLNKWHQLAPIF